MQRITRNTLINYLSFPLAFQDDYEQFRVFDFNNKKIKKGKIIYLCQREIRYKDNPALEFAINLKNSLNYDFKVIHLKEKFIHKQKQIFIHKQIEDIKNQYIKNNIEFEIFNGSKDELLIYLNQINTSILIIDFNPIEDYRYLLNVPFKIYEVDGHNIIPSRLVSNKQEYSAATFRRKIYLNINSYLREFKTPFKPQNEAEFALDSFIQNNLKYYFEFKNNPLKNVTSNLSKYLNLGFVSSKRVVLEVLRANVDNINKEAFLEEMIVRKELADNFCLYCSNFKTFSCVPNWAKESLFSHRDDLRDYIYSLNQLEKAKTHDNLWNAIQLQLIKSGKIHGYLRMYWAKKILEWSISPEVALKNAIYLNDKYAFDSPSCNGYAGILWAIGALHDRAFKDYYVTGKIRRMTYRAMEKKFDISVYIKKWEHENSHDIKTQKIT